MNKQLAEAFDRLRAMPEERQQAAAALLLAFLDGESEKHDSELSPANVAEIEAALAANDFATDEEVEAFFARARK